jgi:hypothetical protein
MRRSQTVRHNPRPSQALNTDDLGILVESDESTEDVLRKQLLEKELENARVSPFVPQLSQFVTSNYVPSVEDDHPNVARSASAAPAIGGSTKP